MDTGSIWKDVLQKVEEKVGRSIFDLWFKPMKLLSVGEKTALVEVPNRFFREWVDDHYPNVLNVALSEVLARDLEVEYVIPDKEDQKFKRSLKALQSRKEWLMERGVHLNPKYTFDTFVVGNSNQLAHAASRKVAENPGFSYNPLFIYGGVGLGKTHLLNAIGNWVIDNDSSKAICYLSSEQFINEVVHSLRNDRMSEFKQKYRNLDILLIDDIQFIANKAATQEEFFHTFNALYEKQRQIVISSDRAPFEIPDITNRLRSRFSMGLIVDVQIPDVETKMAIIYKKAEKEGISIPEDVAYLLATKIKSNIREIEGCLIKLGAYSSLTRIPISLDMAKSVLKELISDDEKPVTVEMIQKVVCEYFGLKVQDIRSKKRTKDLANARQLAMYLSRKYTKLSLSEIGDFFGGKEHATVIHACKQIESKRVSEEEVNRAIENIKKRLNLE